ncbi:MAG: hypothetical protein Q9159_001049 [Coniocarpon cinnabarinum]
MTLKRSSLEKNRSQSNGKKDRGGKDSEKRPRDRINTEQQSATGRGAGGGGGGGGGEWKRLVKARAVQSDCWRRGEDWRQNQSSSVVGEEWDLDPSQAWCSSGFRSLDQSASIKVDQRWDVAEARVDWVPGRQWRKTLRRNRRWRSVWQMTLSKYAALLEAGGLTGLKARRAERAEDERIGDVRGIGGGKGGDDADDDDCARGEGEKRVKSQMAATRKRVE